VRAIALVHQGYCVYDSHMKTVGVRQAHRSALEDQGRVARTAAALRGRGFAPRGVYRFASFEEAETWMLQVMRVPRAPQSPTTSPVSVAR
jgi:hypothetical protein